MPRQAALPEISNYVVNLRIEQMCIDKLLYYDMLNTCVLLAKVEKILYQFIDKLNLPSNKGLTATLVQKG